VLPVYEISQQVVAETWDQVQMSSLTVRLARWDESSELLQDARY